MRQNAPSSSSPVNRKDPQKAVEAHQAMKLQETHARGTMFVGAASIWKAFPANSKPRVSSCAKTPVQLCATCFAYQSARQRNIGIARKKMAKAFEDYLAKE